jgi:hypothetical protein
VNERSARRLDHHQPVTLEVRAAAPPDEVRRADEVGDERVTRPVVDLTGRPNLLDHAVAHHHDAVGDG